MTRIKRYMGIIALLLFAMLAIGRIHVQTVLAEADFTNPVLPVREPVYDAETGTLYLGPGETDTSEYALRGANDLAHWSNSKKGLQGNEYYMDPDYQSLGVKHVLVNIELSTCINYTDGTYHLADTGNAVSYQPLVSQLNKEGVTVTAVILLGWSDDENLQQLIYPTARQGGHSFYNPNCADALGKAAWKNIYSELVQKYSSSDCHIDNWILGNEVNQFGEDCYNYVGSSDLNTVVQAYGDAFKVLDQAIADYYSSARSYISFDHNWTGTDTGFRSKDFLDAFAAYMGGSQWGVAWHPYAPSLDSAAPDIDLHDKVIWNSPGVTNNVKTKYICGSNLDVLTNYMKGKWGSSHRVLLSEQGYDAKGSLPYQAAFIAYTYYAAQYNDMVDGVMFRAYLDAAEEFGLKFGIVAGTDSDMMAATDRAAYLEANKRPAYNVFKYMDTDAALDYTQACLDSIGVTAWRQLLPNYSGPDNEIPVEPAVWKKENGVWYRVQNGNKLTGWVKDGGSWYYLDPSRGGAMATGWFVAGANWYYANGSGVMQTGWLKLGGTWYYLDSSGAMRTGWYTVGNTWYYSNGSGAMQSGGWKQLGGRWYWLEGSGAMRTGWLYTGGKWYYLDSSGAMRTGWYMVGNTWYYSNGSGAMQSGGWKQLGGRWYWLEGSGAMRTGWLSTGGVWYYLDPSSGAMVTGKIELDGTIYTFNQSGAMVSGY